MKAILAALAVVFSVSATPQMAAQAANQIFGGYTAITFNSSFVASTRESGIFISDLNGNALPSAKTPGEVADNLGAVSGVIDLDTGETDVFFRGGFTINYIGRTNVRIENLILHASRTSSVITGDLTENGAFLGRKDIFIVNQNPDLVLPLKPVAGVLTLPNLSLGLAPQLLAQVGPIIGSQFTPATQVATASPVAIVSPEPAAPTAAR